MFLTFCFVFLSCLRFGALSWSWNLLYIVINRRLFKSCIHNIAYVALTCMFILPLAATHWSCGDPFCVRCGLDTSCWKWQINIISIMVTGVYVYLCPCFHNFVVCSVWQVFRNSTVHLLLLDSCSILRRLPAASDEHFLPIFLTHLNSQWYVTNDRPEALAVYNDVF